MNEKYEYDVAISFAEEDKEIALALSHALSLEDLKTYFYPFQRTLGVDLEKDLKEIYSKKAKYAVVLFSQNYFKEGKRFTQIELRAILERMKEEPNVVYLIPVKIDESMSLDEYPEIESLTFFKWGEYAAEVLATDLKKMLGKQLVKVDEYTVPGSIIYFHGEQSLAISGSNSENINPALLSNSSQTPVIVTKSGEGITVNQISFQNPTETKYPCPNCAQELDSKKYGINTCPACKKLFFIENPSIKASKYITVVDEADKKEYNKIRAHIRNKIRDKDYKGAYEYCLKAEELAPGESCTWEHFAMTEFLMRIYEDKNERDETREIIASVKRHLDKSKDCGIKDNEYDGLRIDIANKLFSIQKARVNSIQPQYRDRFGNPKWSRQNFEKLSKLLESFEICYGLSLKKDINFLKSYVNELCKEHKWIFKTSMGKLVNNPACVSFNAIKKLDRLVGIIQQVEPGYTSPVISEERFTVHKVNRLTIKQITK